MSQSSLLLSADSLLLPEMARSPDTSRRQPPFSWFKSVGVPVLCAILAALLTAYFTGSWGFFTEAMEGRISEKVKGSREFTEISSNLKIIRESVVDVKVAVGRMDERLKGLERQVFADKIKTAGINPDHAQVIYVEARPQKSFHVSYRNLRSDFAIDVDYIIEEVQGQGITVRARPTIYRNNLLYKKVPDSPPIFVPYGGSGTVAYSFDMFGGEHILQPLRVAVVKKEQDQLVLVTGPAVGPA